MAKVAKTHKQTLPGSVWQYYVAWICYIVMLIFAAGCVILPLGSSLAGGLGLWVAMVWAGVALIYTWPLLAGAFVASLVVLVKITYPKSQKMQKAECLAMMSLCLLVLCTAATLLCLVPVAGLVAYIILYFVLIIYLVR